ncbi:hypothetical protein B296_00018713 [Ensete ventricosum]|uniref:Uncharacterized protein n=1 Tax=Ensete ventricosum TaxID=4639 RepID=A0A427AIA2_ENSVE|nr:hypothetical protein B296_00018713 [Ensete ventricosum]
MKVGAAYERARSSHLHVVCMQGWLATAKLHVGATDHGLAICRVGRLRPRPPAGAASWRLGRLWLGRKGRPPATRPQGVALVARATVNRGNSRAMWCRPPVGAATRGQEHPPAGKGNHRLRNDNGNTVRARARVSVFL